MTGRTFGPGARNVDLQAWRSVLEAPGGVEPGRPVVTYRRIGERGGHTWFVFQEVLGIADVNQREDSWFESASMIAVELEAA